MRKLEKKKLIIIGYFSIILISAMGWIFADEIEGFLITMGYSFLKNWIWPIFFAINIGTISIGTQIISKIFIGEKWNNPEIQKKSCLSTFNIEARSLQFEIFDFNRDWI